MSITAIVENDTIKLPLGVHVPDGTRAEVMLRTDKPSGQAPGSFYESIEDLIGSVDGLPENLGTELGGMVSAPFDLPLPEPGVPVKPRKVAEFFPPPFEVRQSDLAPE
jgi:hypothetical protein